jgi:hypothetical protein
MTEKKKAKVTLLFRRGDHAIMADLVPKAPGLVIHKARLFEEGMEKPKPPSWGGWTVTHTGTGKKATPLPLPSREAAVYYAQQTSEVVPWEYLDGWTDNDWHKYSRITWRIWNSANEKFGDQWKKAIPTPKAESDESA